MDVHADAAKLTTNETIPSHGLFIDRGETAASNAELLDVLNRRKNRGDAKEKSCGPLPSA
jgi:hypothetical protein